MSEVTVPTLLQFASPLSAFYNTGLNSIVLRESKHATSKVYRQVKTYSLGLFDTQTPLRLDYFWEEEALAAMKHCEGWRGMISAGYGVGTKFSATSIGGL
ncbi:hypothetical protein HAX54_028328 [Datura stramonium]|uniref:Uncharacterized protein n=1 Tax=Datura stramonium TaxID=4076 RepID=A0ABS8S9J2_DATST|nr:hypothetical protein [Datura stramonium]